MLARSNFETEQYILRIERISFTGGKKGRARILYIIVEVEYSKIIKIIFIYKVIRIIVWIRIFSKLLYIYIIYLAYSCTIIILEHP